MEAENLTFFDGHWYKPGEEIPDLGTFVAAPGSGAIRNYNGLSVDVSKLPKYDDLMSGSSAFCMDTAELYMYEQRSKTWMKCGG